MTFAGLNYLAVFVAGIAGWLAGAAYYGILGKPWVAAHDKTMDSFKAEQAAWKGTVHAWLPFALALLAEWLMAYMLAGLAGHMGPVTVRNAVVSGLHVWIGFILTTQIVNNAFAGSRYMLTLINAGHWLVVILVMGVVIGWMGV